MNYIGGWRGSRPYDNRGCGYIHYEGWDASNCRNNNKKPYVCERMFLSFDMTEYIKITN